MKLKYGKMIWWTKSKIFYFFENVAKLTKFKAHKFAEDFWVDCWWVIALLLKYNKHLKFKEIFQKTQKFAVKITL